MIVSNWLGIRNQNPIRSIPDNALSDATDIDIEDVGILTQRRGNVFSKPISITTGYSTIDQAGYIVTGGVLYRVLPDLSTIPIVNSTATEFCDFGKVLFSNDGFRIEDDIATDLKIPISDNPPSLSITSGNLPAGTYRAMFCYRSSTGLEGGSSPAGSVTLTSIGGVAVEPIVPPSGFTVNIYMTDADGTVFYDNNGIQIKPIQVLAESFPANAEQIAFYDRRLFISESLSNGTTVIRFSKPYYFHIYDFATDYIIIQELFYF